MPVVELKGNKIILIKGGERMEVKAKEIWETFGDRRTTVPCIRCYERGGQCTRNYPAGCKGHV